jgi:hypothetical protein
MSLANIQINDFTYNLNLRDLLIKYISRQYEENALFDDYHMLQEYEYLKKRGELHLLFEEEWFSGYMNDPKNYKDFKELQNETSNTRQTKTDTN